MNFPNVYLWYSYVPFIHSSNACEDNDAVYLRIIIQKFEITNNY